MFAAYPHPFRPLWRALAAVRADDLAAISIEALIDRNRMMDWATLDDGIYGCANQAGNTLRPKASTVDGVSVVMFCFFTGGVAFPGRQPGEDGFALPGVKSTRRRE